MPEVLIVLEVSEKLALPHSVRCIVLRYSLGDCLGHLMSCPVSISLNTFKWSSLGVKRVRFSGYRHMGLCLNPFRLLIVLLFFQQSLTPLLRSLFHSFLSTFLLLPFPFTLAFCVQYFLLQLTPSNQNSPFNQCLF